MKVNRKKTEILVCFKDPENVNIKMDDNTLKQVPQFKYLRNIFTDVGEIKEDVIKGMK
jgi:hypothetical protein